MMYLRAFRGVFLLGPVAWCQSERQPLKTLPVENPALLRTLPNASSRARTLPPNTGQR